MQSTEKKFEWVKPELEKMSVEETLSGTSTLYPEGSVLTLANGQQTFFGS